MELKILHFYPDLMSLYGSYANAAVLRRTLEQLGNTVSVQTVQPGETADVASADLSSWARARNGPRSLLFPISFASARP